jgi:signal transduction histidine kinase
MLGELARRSLDGNNPGAADLIDQMASTSREAVSAMGDIVWSIHPHKDKMDDLVQRMRRFASDLLEGQGIAFHLEAPSEGAPQVIPPEVRRDVMLLFKESIHNASRHARCSSVRAEVLFQNGQLHLRVQDDGCGINPQDHGRGHGLQTMRARTERVGGKFEVTSGVDAGTLISATFLLE